MEFKVNDRVTVVSAESLKEYIGKSGIIHRMECSYAYITFDCDGASWGFHVNKLKKEAKGMTKGELKNYQLVQLRDGDWYVLFRDTGYGYYKDLLAGYGKIQQTNLDTHEDDLTYCDYSIDIMKVASANTLDILKGVLKKDCSTPAEQLSSFKVIWERKNHKVSQLESVVSNLQEQIQKAQDELKELRA